MSGILGNGLITDFLTLWFNNTAAANWGDATGIRASSTAGSLYVALHTADPGAAGAQNTSEAGYTGYTRVGVTRSGATGWTITNQSVSPTTVISFPAGTGGGETVTYATIGRDSSGAGRILVRCALLASIATGNLVTPTIQTSAVFTMA